jgi:hypothetical protein
VKFGMICFEIYGSWFSSNKILPLMSSQTDVNGFTKSEISGPKITKLSIELNELGNPENATVKKDPSLKTMGNVFLWN